MLLLATMAFGQVKEDAGDGKAQSETLGDCVKILIFAS